MAEMIIAVDKTNWMVTNDLVNRLEPPSFTFVFRTSAALNAGDDNGLKYVFDLYPEGFLVYVDKSLEGLNIAHIFFHACQFLFHRRPQWHFGKDPTADHLFSVCSAIKDQV